MHLDDGDLQRLLHHERPDAPASGLERHARACAACVARLEAAARDEREIFAMLAHLDHPVPVVDPAVLGGRARPRTTGRIGWAAALLLAIGLAGAAYAAPASPLRAWVSSLAALGTHDRVPSGTTSPRAAPPAPMSGLTLAPGPELVIEVVPREHGVAQVSLVHGAEVTLRAPAGAASYTAGATRVIVVVTRDSVTIAIGIPRTTRRVELRVAGVPVLQKAGVAVTSVVAAGTDGAYWIPLEPRR